MSTSTSKQQEINALANLREQLKGCTTTVCDGKRCYHLHATVTSVASSGMSRTITFIAYHPGRGIYVCLDATLGELLGCARTDKGIRVSGCGMDMVFATLYRVNQIALRHMRSTGDTYNALVSTQNY